MSRTKKITLSGLFLAIGLILPFITGQISEIGNMLLPMHIPVLICGFICGPAWGTVVGFITPILRSAIFGMPFMMPTAVCMAFELATYGAVAGSLYRCFRQTKAGTYASLLISMFAGRAVWGVVSVFAYGVMGSAFSWEIFLSGAFVQAFPGIVLQLVIIPPLIFALKKVNFLDVQE